MQQSDFSKLARRLRPRILSDARRIITDDPDAAEDIAQEVLLRLWQNRARLAQMRSVDALAAVITRNLTIDALRRRRPTVDLDALAELPSELPQADAATLRAEQQQELDAVMAKLAPAQQAVLRMRHLDGLEIAEIAQLIGSNENNVRVLLCRARSRVRQLFQQQN